MIDTVYTKSLGSPFGRTAIFRYHGEESGGLPHAHGSFQFTGIIAGTFFIEFSGKRRCELGPGDAIMIAPEMSHTWRSAPGKKTLAAVIFCDSFQPGQYGEISDWLAPWIRDKYWTAQIGLTPLARYAARVSEIMRKHSKLENSLLFVEHLSIMTSFIEAAAGKRGFPLGTRPSEPTLKALYRIESEYMRGLSLEELAESARLSVSRFSTRFRAETGRSPVQALNSFRIGKASELLLYSSLPIAEIARKTGFATEHYFSRAFKKATKLPPGAYRKQRSSE